MRNLSDDKLWAISRRPRRGRTRPFITRSFRPFRQGFTLIETALATVIIGVGVLALVEAQTSFMRSNAWSTQAATATYLANEIRELTRNLPKTDPVNGLYLDTSGGGNVLRGWGPRNGDVDARDFAYLTAFDGITFRSNGTAGFDDGDLPGPIDGFGNTIPDVDNNGAVRLGANGQPMNLQGWSQEVVVQKVDPFDHATVYADDAELAPNASTGFKGLGVDQLPMRVTVIVRFQGPYDSEAMEMGRVSWIAP